MPLRDEKGLRIERTVDETGMGIDQFLGSHSEQTQIGHRTNKVSEQIVDREESKEATGRRE